MKQVVSEKIQKQDTIQFLYSIQNRQSFLSRILNAYSKVNLELTSYDPAVQGSTSAAPTFADGERSKKGNLSKKSSMMRQSSIFGMDSQTTNQVSSAKYTAKMLINNEGNNVRRTRLSMPLMDNQKILQRQNTQLGRRKKIFVNQQSGSAPADLLAIYQISDQIIEKVDQYIEKIKKRKKHQSGSREDDEEEEQESNNLQEDGGSAMETIMQMVKANSQIEPIQGLILNTVNNLPVFVQLVHNTTDDSIILLFIKDFNTLKIEEVPLSEIQHLYHLRILYERYGYLNQNVVMSVNSFFTSNEFQLLIEDIMHENL